uniref:C-type lectin domain-containing protein n=1 Tax=Mandrillus leucophaeus TaxID=9568 RepID=A0A2K5XDB9_MANLE
MAQPNSCFILISCLMFLSLSQGQEVQTDLPKARISCPEGTNAYGSYLLHFLLQQLYCQNMNSGCLRDLTDKKTSTDDGNVWIGLYDPKKNRRWHWSSGSLVSYKSWVIGSPSSINPGYCVSLTSSSGFKGWKDVSCEEKFSFVCKFKN